MSQQPDETTFPAIPRWLQIYERIIFPASWYAQHIQVSSMFQLNVLKPFHGCFLMKFSFNNFGPRNLLCRGRKIIIRVSFLFPNSAKTPLFTSFYI